MSKVYFVFFTLLFLKVAYTVAGDCGKQLQDLKTCMKNKKDDDNLGSVESKIENCFKKNKCEAPELHSETLANKSGSGYERLLELKKAYDNLSKEVQQCLNDRYRYLALAQLNKCLKDKNKTEITLNETSAVYKVFGTDNERRNKSLLTKSSNVVLAILKCRLDKGSDKSDATAKCVKDVKNDVKDEICIRAENCTEEKLTGDCNKRAKEIAQTACECRKNRMKEIQSNLKKLKDDKDHDNVDLGNVLGADYNFQDINNKLVSAVEDCARGIHEMLVDLKKTPASPLAVATAIYGNHPRKIEQVMLEILLNDDGGNLIADNISVAYYVITALLDNFTCGCQ